jgi:hypothetical protein
MLAFSENLENENYYSTTNVIFKNGALVFDADFFPMYAVITVLGINKILTIGGVNRFKHDFSSNLSTC